MSEAFASVVVGGVVTVLLAAIAAYLELRMRLIRTQEDIRRVEIATNSMKDALVAAALQAGLAQGAAEERAKHEEETE